MIACVVASIITVTIVPEFIGISIKAVQARAMATRIFWSMRVLLGVS